MSDTTSNVKGVANASIIDNSMLCSDLYVVEFRKLNKKLSNVIAVHTKMPYSFLV